MRTRIQVKKLRQSLIILPLLSLLLAVLSACAGALLNQLSPVKGFQLRTGRTLAPKYFNTQIQN